MHIGSVVPSLHIELHISRDDSLHLGAARIHHCLLRVKYSGSVQILTEGSTAIGDLFAHSAYLETVVVETGLRFKTDHVQALIDALREGCTVEVHNRTSDEAHELALQAEKSPSRSISAGLLSPYWCLQERAEDWEFR